MPKNKKAIVCMLLVLVGLALLKVYADAARLSALVGFSRAGKTADFVKNPGISCVESYFYFEDELKDDVIFGVDQEFIEGTTAPLYLKGGDWMAFVGLQRTGTVWVASGTEATLSGKPSKERKWEILNLGSSLRPKTWYRIQCRADFGTRHFVDMQVEGPGLNKTLDLSKYKLDYPNFMPFDGAAMTYYVHAMRGRSMMKEEGKPIIFFDDLRGSLASKGESRLSEVFYNDCESQPKILKQPVSGPPIKLDNYRDGIFYFERDEARAELIESPVAHSGRRLVRLDAGL